MCNKWVFCPRATWCPRALWVYGEIQCLGESEMLSSMSEAQMCNIWILRGIKGMRN
jgi:hypothetical protein